MTEYTGKENLDFLEVVPNYLDAIESLILKFLNPYKTALDFGAGSGIYVRRLSAKGIKVDAVEIDPEYAAQLGAFRSLDEVPSQYERIYTCDVIEHIQDDLGVLKQLHSKLTQGGRIFVYVPAFNVLYSEMDKKIGHFRRYTKASLVPKLEAANFKIISAEYVDCIGFFGALFFKYFGSGDGSINSPSIYKYYKYIFPIGRFLDACGAKYLLGKNLLVVAEKT
jgi:SAM-dependent methyltransferase